MKSILKFSGLLLVIILWTSACQNDGQGKANDQVENNIDKGHDHSNSGHDHSHDGHTHDDGNKKYERKSKPSVQVTAAERENNAKNVDIDQMLEEGRGSVPAEVWAKKKEAAQTEKVYTPPIELGKNSVKTKLPSTCTLISPEKLGKIVGVNSKMITLKDGSGRSNPHSQSCFFQMGKSRCT